MTRGTTLPITRLSPVKVIMNAISVTWERREPLSRALFLPAVTMIFIDLLELHLMRDEALTALLLKMGLGVLRAFPSTIFAVTCHRFILRGPEASSLFRLPPWTRRETRFLGWAMATACLAGLVGLLCTIPLAMTDVLSGHTGQIQDIRTILVLVPCVLLPTAYVFSRIALVLPATALNLRPTLNSSFTLSKGDGWRLTLALAILPAVVFTPFKLLMKTVPLQPGATIITICGGCLRCVVLALDVAILSTAYKDLLMTKSPGLAELVFGNKREGT
jgi:hypothetical protein